MPLSGDKPLSVAVVGLGYWGPNVARALYELEDAELSVVCDRREEALAKFLRRYPAVGATTDIHDVLCDEAVDAVVFRTPVAPHFSLAGRALEAGKHVFVEKPLAASSDEAATLINLAADSALVLMPGHTFLYSPPVTKVRDLIVSGELGDLYFISMSRVNLGIHQPDVSVLWDLAPHDFSILTYWLREVPIKISASSRCCVVPDTPDVA